MDESTLTIKCLALSTTLAAYGGGYSLIVKLSSGFQFVNESQGQGAVAARQRFPYPPPAIPLWKNQGATELQSSNSWRSTSASRRNALRWQAHLLKKGIVANSPSPLFPLPTSHESSPIPSPTTEAGSPVSVAPTGASAGTSVVDFQLQQSCDRPYTRSQDLEVLREPKQGEAEEELPDLEDQLEIEERGEEEKEEQVEQEEQEEQEQEEQKEDELEEDKGREEEDAEEEIEEEKEKVREDSRAWRLRICTEALQRWDKDSYQLLYYPMNKEDRAIMSEMESKLRKEQRKDQDC